MRRGSSGLGALAGLAVAAVLALAGGTAYAREAERVLPGQKLWGELASGESFTVLVHGVEGLSFSASCRAWRGSELRPDLALADPTGKDVTPALARNGKGTKVSFSGFVLGSTGSWRLTVRGVGSTRGGFDLATKGVAPKKLKGAVVVTAPGAVASVSFAGMPLDVATCTVKPARGSALKPVVARFVDAGGATIDFTPAKKSPPVTASTNGVHRFEVSGEGDTVGTASWTLAIRRAKAPRDARDAAELDAVGTVTGVIVLEGQVQRDSAGPLGRRGGAPRKARAPDVRSGELVVAGTGDREEVARVLEAAVPGERFEVVRSLTPEGPHLVRVERLAGHGADRRRKAMTRTLAGAAAGAPGVAWCEANRVIQACWTEPGDPRWEEQFHLRYIRLPRAWDFTTGDASVVVAVVDTGKWAHPDLSQNLLPGYDFVTDPSESLDGDGWDADPTDAAHDFHGTHVAGIVGARTNNKAGIAGAVWQTRIVPVRVLGKNGGTFFDVAAGVRWASGGRVEGVPDNPNPARVVNMSLGAPWDAEELRTAVAGALARGAVVVAAAGNEGTDEPFYPAAYPGVIAVYALDQNLQWASYSNWGDWIGVGAPGGDPFRGQPGILSTVGDPASLQPSYAEWSGTSMASPQVAGVAALMLAAKPTLTPAEVKTILEETALDLGEPGFDVDYGFGMVNAGAALERVVTPWAPPGALEVVPAELDFTASMDRLPLSVRTARVTPVEILGVEARGDTGLAWLTAVSDAPATPATVMVSLVPDLPVGRYTGNVRITTDVGVVDVPARAVRTPRPRISVVLVSATTIEGEVLATATTRESLGWQYTLQGVPLGRYRIVAASDENSNLRVDRVDEWQGRWPLPTEPTLLEVAPDDLDHGEVNVPLVRWDNQFTYDGVGAGRIDGALAVRVADAVTGRPIAGADVRLGDDSLATVTDVRGRALFVGPFSGAQTVTVTAAGYRRMTRAGLDAQYQSFALEPDVGVPTTAVAATVRGLGPLDRGVWLQIGDALGYAPYDAATDPVIPLAVRTTVDSYPVSAVAVDASGVPTRSALYETDTLAPALDVAVAALPPGGAQQRPANATLPSANFTAAGANLVSNVQLRWGGERWLHIGTAALVPGASSRGWFADPGAFQPALTMRFAVRAVDTWGRESERHFYGTTDYLNPTEVFTLDAPPGLVSPANGATGQPRSPTLQFTPSPGAHLTRVTVTETATGGRWVFWLPGTASSVTVPALAGGSLSAGATYRWTVESWRFAAFDANAYLEGRLDTDTLARTFSGSRTFTTQ